MTKSVEQLARDMLERCGWDEAQRLTAGDVIEVANVLADRNRLLAEVERLRGIGGKPLRTADGVSLALGQLIWTWRLCGDAIISGCITEMHADGGDPWVKLRLDRRGVNIRAPSECFSTREAAEAARGNPQ